MIEVLQVNVFLCKISVFQGISLDLVFSQGWASIGIGVVNFCLLLLS
jgi:hypothetical protein